MQGAYVFISKVLFISHLNSNIQHISKALGGSALPLFEYTKYIQVEWKLDNPVEIPHNEATMNEANRTQFTEFKKTKN